MNCEGNILYTTKNYTSIGKRVGMTSREDEKDSSEGGGVLAAAQTEREMFYGL